MRTTDHLSLEQSPVSTDTSLLRRIKCRDERAWQTLATLYTPMVYRWARKAGLQSQDAVDVVQNVFLSVTTDIRTFRRDRTGDSFRGWLWTICRHKILDYFRENQKQPVAVGGSTMNQRFQQLSEEIVAEDSDEVKSEVGRLRQRVLTLLREQFDEHVRQSFLRTVLHNDKPADVARDLGIAVSTVYRARARVLQWLRTEFAEISS